MLRLSFDFEFEVDFEVDVGMRAANLRRRSEAQV